eukprot:TRINITY_DN17787_c0_g1_i5.p1 TRINITY_DN17787_c0_g1~~TRINITY_DN17787_c0_g1_i5.p1  ORF type:complete len:430 (+),score=86.10 TRINITY_DN17787_c0_g1_i5:122-1411(+)
MCIRDRSGQHDEVTKKRGRIPKRFWVKDPAGRPVSPESGSLAEFCRRRSLNVQCMSSVARGNSRHHKGWTCGYVDVHVSKSPKVGQAMHLQRVQVCQLRVFSHEGAAATSVAVCLAHPSVQLGEQFPHQLMREMYVDEVAMLHLLEGVPDQSFMESRQFVIRSISRVSKLGGDLHPHSVIGAAATLFDAVANSSHPILFQGAAGNLAVLRESSVLIPPSVDCSVLPPLEALQATAIQVPMGQHFACGIHPAPRAAQSFADLEVPKMSGAATQQCSHLESIPDPLGRLLPSLLLRPGVRDAQFSQATGQLLVQLEPTTRENFGMLNYVELLGTLDGSDLPVLGVVVTVLLSDQVDHHVHADRVGESNGHGHSRGADVYALVAAYWFDRLQASQFYCSVGQVGEVLLRKEGEQLLVSCLTKLELCGQMHVV